MISYIYGYVLDKTEKLFGTKADPSGVKSAEEYIVTRGHGSGRKFLSIRWKYKGYN